MVWHWLISCLGLGSTLVLYDGAPFWPKADSLWRLIQDERISYFGTSARFLSACNKEGVHPARYYDLKPLRLISSTGSPLAPESSRYVYAKVKQDVSLASL